MTPVINLAKVFILTVCIGKKVNIVYFVLGEEIWGNYHEQYNELGGEIVQEIGSLLHML